MNFVLKLFFSDIDECAAGTDNCSANAVCNDLEGGFECECNTGFSGDGVNCTGESQLLIILCASIYDFIFSMNFVLK